MSPGMYIPDKTREEIFNLYQEGKYSQKDLARKFGVSHGSITNIVRRYKEHPQLDDIEKEGEDRILDLDKLHGKREKEHLSIIARIERLEEELGFV